MASTRNDLNDEPSKLETIDIQSYTLSQSPRRCEAAAWFELLENYTAQLSEPRSGVFPHQQDAVVQDEHLAPIVTILENARSRGDIDLLAYIGKSTERWEVTDWMIRGLLEKCNSYDSTNGDDRIDPFWIGKGQTGDRSLDEVLENAIDTGDLSKSFAYGSDTTKWKSAVSAEYKPSLEKRALSQILQSLGSMIVEAEDNTEDRKAHQTVMTYFVNILAQLHRTNAVPMTIYNYDPPGDPTVIQRPPLLYYLSSRIMTHIANVAWNKYWLLQIAQAEKEGEELPPEPLQPQISPVGTEVWLEFVLWLCVEGGWIPEASWILSQVEKHSNQGDRQWSTTSWEDICRKEAPKMGFTTLVKAQIDRARLGQVTGIPFATSGVSNIDMGHRTISVEVVSAILDGVVNIGSSTRNSSEGPMDRIIQTIRNCQSLLGRSGHNVNAETMNAVILRLLEASSLETTKSATDVENVGLLSLVLENAQQPNEAQQTSLEESDMDPSGCILGLLHRTLEAFAVNGDERGVTRTLERILNIIDANRNLYIRDFARELRQRLEEGKQSTFEQEQKLSPLLQPQVPLYVLDELLTFVTDHQLTWLGDFLFHSNEIDGGFIQSPVFAETKLQPRLIQYAIANSDQKVLTRVIEQIQPPIPPEIIHALLRYRILNHQWEAVEQMLLQLSSSRDTSWTAGDVMTIAAYVIRHVESNGDKEHKNADNARRVLTDVLRGRYDPPKDPSRPADLSRIRLANQLKRILLTVPDSVFTFLSYNTSRQAGRLSSAATVSSSAFNSLLDAIVERFGCIAGRNMWERWCAEPKDIAKASVKVNGPLNDRRHSAERVIEPTRFLVRTIITPIASKIKRQPKMTQSEVPGPQQRGSEAGWSDRKRVEPLTRVLSQDELSLLTWAVQMYQKLGADIHMVEREIPCTRDLLSTVAGG